MNCFQSALALTIILGSPAGAVNWETSGNPDVDAWYASAQRNGGGSCCGAADSYWAQLTKVQDDGVWVLVDDDREILGRIPRDKQEFFVSNEILDKRRQGNPTGHVVLFVGVADAQPLCLFMGEGI